MSIRKLTAIFIMLVFVAGMLVGCGGSNGGSQTESGSENTGGETGGQSADGEPSGGEAATGDAIVVGVNFELSGQLAGYGQTKLNGAKIALDEINAAGGVLGRPIRLVEYDNKGDNAEAINISTRLMGEDKVAVMMGPVTSGRVMASIDVAKQFQIPMVTGTGTSPGITVNADGSVNDFVYRICFIDPYQGTLAANYATETLGLMTAATLVNQSDDYSIYMAEAFKDTFISNGGQIVDENTFMEGDLDFKAALTKINATGAEMIFVPNYYEPDALIAKQAQEIGYDGYLMGGDGWDNLDHMVGTAGAEALQKAFFINHYFPGDTMEKNQDFVEKYTALYGSAPPSFAALGYDLMHFVADAIDRSGSTDSVEINKAIADTSNFEGITGAFAMGDNHDPIKSAVVIGYDAEGNYVLVDKVQ